MEGSDVSSVPKILQEDMVNTLLSPRAHLVNRDAFDKQGEKGKAILEHQIYQRCVEGILSGGEGTLESPYPVLREDDVEDVLRHLEKLETAAFDRFVFTEGRYLEIYQAGESPLVFDATVPYQWLNRWLGDFPQSMAPRLAGFFLHPNIGEFMRLRSLLVESEAFNPYSSHLRRCMEAVMAQDWPRAEELILADMPNLLFSPRAHQLLAKAAEERGDGTSALLRMQFAQALYQMLMETGDGSPKRPWICLREEDEHDIMGGLGAAPKGYKSVGGDERYVEHLLLEDGRSFFLDLTVPFTHVNRLFSVDA